MRMTRQMIKQAGLKSRTAGPTDGLSEQSPYGWWSREHFDPADDQPDSKIRQCGGAWGHCLNAQVFHGDPIGNVRIDHAIPWRDGFEQYTYDDYEEAMAACDAKDGTDGMDVCQGFKVGRLYKSMNSRGWAYTATDMDDVNMLRGGAQWHKNGVKECDARNQTSVLEAAPTLDGTVVKKQDGQIIGTKRDGDPTVVEDTGGNVVGILNSDGAVIADSATCASYTVEQCQTRENPSVCCQECSSYVGDRSGGRKAYLMADYCGSQTSKKVPGALRDCQDGRDCYYYERYDTTLTCQNDTNTVGVATRGPRHAKCTYDDVPDINRIWQTYRGKVSDFSAIDFHYSSAQLNVDEEEQSCASENHVVCDTSIEIVPPVFEDSEEVCGDNKDCLNKEEQLRDMATICMSEAVKTNPNCDVCNDCRTVRTLLSNRLSTLEEAKNDAFNDFFLRSGDSDKCATECDTDGGGKCPSPSSTPASTSLVNSNGYNGEEYSTSCPRL